ncbi:MAG: ATP-dependent helicase [Chloroflexota bacterium]
MAPTESWLKGIKGDALPKLIQSDAPVIRVVAGPGSGKTLAIQRRTWRLIEGAEVSPSRIFVGAFSREIVKQLAASVAAISSDMEISTLHSLALRLLKDNPVAVGDRKLRILLDYEKAPMLYDVGHATSYSDNQNGRKKLLKKLEAAHSERLTIAETAFSAEVERWLREHGGLLMDEFVPMATAALEYGDIPKGTFDHIMVDEYQDLTKCEQALVDLVWSGNGSLAVLGDDAQSIFSFRHNHPDGITGFGERWKELGVEDHPLNENYRSGSDLVEVANKVIARATTSKVPMIPMSDEDSLLAYVYWPSIDEEIDGLAEYIRRNKANEYLVLVPFRDMGYRLRDKVGPDAATSFLEQIIEKGLPRERFMLASLLGAPEDRVALRSWFALQGATPADHSTRNAQAFASIREAMCSATPFDSLEFCRSVAEGTISVNGSGMGNIIDRAKAFVKLAGEAPAELDALIDWVFDESLADHVEDPEDRRRSRADLAELNGGAHQIVAESNSESFSGVVSGLRYKIGTRTPFDAPDPRVRITTLHASKGLQADRVIVAGLADQIIPGITTSTAEREERRRLLYVAITRAKKELVLSQPNGLAAGFAQQNYVRIDPGTRKWKDGERWVYMRHSSFIPLDLPVSPINGQEWLEATAK